MTQTAISKVIVKGKITGLIVNLVAPVFWLDIEAFVKQKQSSK